MAKIKNNGGYVCIPRKICDHPFFKERTVFTKGHALIDLWFAVRYMDDPARKMINGKLIEWGKGQMPISLRYLGTRWQWSTKKVSNFLSQLESDGIITLDETQAGSMLQINDYSINTKEKQQKKQQKKQQEPTQDGVLEEIGNIESNTEKHDEETVRKQRGNKTEKKEAIKEENKESSKDKEAPCEKKNESIVLPWQSESFKEKWREWKQHLKDEKKKKFRTAKSEQAQIRKLNRISNGTERLAIEILDQAIDENWASFWELKNKKNGTRITAPIPKQQEAGTFGAF